MDRSVRRANKEKGQGHYNPSTTEILLEQVCDNFGTELEEAHVRPNNGSKLVRLSQPAVLTHPDGSVRVVQFQHTRFTPEVSGRFLDAYNSNRSLETGKGNLRSMDSAIREIESEHPDWDSFNWVTETQQNRYMKIHRWPKGLYVAIYRLPQTLAGHPRPEKALQPFDVHEVNDLKGELPEVRITWSIEPIFCIGGLTHKEPTRGLEDRMDISFPDTFSRHRESHGTGLALHPLNKLGTPEDAFSEPSYVSGTYIMIKSNVPRQQTMGFIQAYIRKHCLDKDI